MPYALTTILQWILSLDNVLKKKTSKPSTDTIPNPEELLCMFFKWAQYTSETFQQLYSHDSFHQWHHATLN